MNELTVDGQTRVTEFSSATGWSERWVSNEICVAMKTDLERRMELQQLEALGVRVSASGSAADTPEGRRALAELKACLVMVDEAWGPYTTAPKGNRATRRRAAAQARRP